MRDRLFTLGAVARAVGFTLVPAAMLATAMVLGRHGPLSQIPTMTFIAPQTYPLTHEINRCELLGTAAEQDSKCEAVWAEIRRRFFIYGPASSDSRRMQTRNQPAARSERQ